MSELMAQMGYLPRCRTVPGKQDHEACCPCTAQHVGGTPAVLSKLSHDASLHQGLLLLSWQLTMGLTSTFETWEGQRKWCTSKHLGR